MWAQKIESNSQIRLRLITKVIGKKIRPRGNARPEEIAASRLGRLERSRGTHFLFTSHDLVGVGFSRFQPAEHDRVVLRAAPLEGSPPVPVVVTVLYVSGAVLVGCPGDGRRSCGHITYGWAACDLHRLFQRLFARTSLGWRLRALRLARRAAQRRRQ